MAVSKKTLNSNNASGKNTSVKKLKANLAHPAAATRLKTASSGGGTVLSGPVH